MNFDTEILQAEALLTEFGCAAAQLASDCADTEAMNLRDESAASWRRVTALILASSQPALQLVHANVNAPPQIALAKERRHGIQV
jgi:hypothetical protein